MALPPAPRARGGRASSSAPAAGGGARGDPPDRETVAEAAAAEPGTPRWLWLEAPAEPQHASRPRQRTQTGGQGCVRSRHPGSTDGNQR